MSEDYHGILRQVRSSRIKYVYSALVEIRKSLIKSDKGVESLVAGGLVERLVELLQTWETIPDQFRSKVTDISASILGNMCMLDVARKQVLKTSGIHAVAQLLITSDSESIQNRCCRCLANILLSPGSWKLVHDTPVVERIIKLLNDVDNDECKLTYIRALRLLGQTGKHVQVILDKKGAFTVANFVDCVVENIAQSALRCLLSLSTHCCSVEFATQIVTSGKVPYLLTAASEHKQEAFQLIVRLCNLPNFRLEFGNANGINQFVEMYKSSDEFFRNLRHDLVDVLSMCCKEAVNRVKLRESGSLEILVSSLSDKDFLPLHARVISALICFLYDQASFDVLLEHGLVNSLVKLLSDYMKQCDESSKDDVASKVKLKSLPNHKELDDGVNNYVKENQDSVSEYNPPTFADDETHQKQRLQLKNEEKDGHFEEVNANNIGKDSCTKEQNKDTHTNTHIKKEDDKSMFKAVTSNEECIKLELGDEKVLSGDEIKHPTEDDLKQRSSDATSPSGHDQNMIANDATEGCNKYKDSLVKDTKDDDDKDEVHVGSPTQRRKQPVYSIDSPTYQSVIAWDAEQYSSGAKCIARFTPPHDWEYSAPVCSYSPLSNSSYYSPSEGSPEYFCSGTSPQGKTGSEPSPNSWSPALHYKRNIYTGITSVGSMSLSPDSSPERWISEGSHPTSSSDVSGSLLSLDTDEISNVSSLFSSASNSSSSFPHGQSKGASCCSSVNVVANHSNIDGGNQDDRDIPVKIPMNVHQDTISKSIEKPEAIPDNIVMSKKRKKITNRSVVYENNILILMSRISQTTDPSKHLVTMASMETLINYIGQTASPLARAARLLSRVFRNPLCFEDLLRLKIPTVIFDTLLQEENIKFLMIKVLKRRHEASKRRRSSSKFDSSSDEVNDSDRYSSTCQSPGSDDVHPSKRQRRHSDESKHVQHYKGTYHRQGEAVCNSGQCAIAFLEDLSEVADSSYGRGLVEKMLCEDQSSSKLDLCLTLMYITWSSNARDFFCKQLIVLDQVMSVLKDHQYRNSNKEYTAITGLSLVTQAMDTHSRYCKNTAIMKYSVDECWVREQPNNQRLLRDISSSQSSHDPMLSIVSSLGCDSCVLMDKTFHDLNFLIDGEVLPANRGILMESSDIFTAMLDGKYAEASLSVIPISNTSVCAFKHILHYLHGCKKENCPTILSIYNTEVSRNSAINCIDTITEADKYLLHSLKEELTNVLHERYIIPESALPAFKFSVLHGYETLQKCAVSSVFVDNDSVKSLIRYVGEFLDSPYKDVFLQLLEDMLTE